MVLFISALGILLVVFSREILLQIIIAVTHATRSDPGASANRSQAHFKKRIRFYLCKVPCIETLDFPTWFGPSILVSEKLWDRMPEAQKEAWLLWAYAAQTRSGFFRRWFFAFPILPTDRDVGLLGGNPLAFVEALSTALQQRDATPPTLLGQIFSAFSLLGSSLLSSWPNLEDRKKSMARYLADWNKAE